MGGGERETEEGEEGENGYEWVKGALYTGLKYSVPERETRSWGWRLMTG